LGDNGRERRCLKLRRERNRLRRDKKTGTVLKASRGPLQGEKTRRLEAKSHWGALKTRKKGVKRKMKQVIFGKLNGGARIVYP